MNHVKTNSTINPWLVIIILLLLTILTVFLSCDQDSVFADIAVEPPPVDPKIDGSSTNIVVLDGKAYMASIGSSFIHSYKNGQWAAFSADGKVAGIAATTERLYALVYYGNDRLDTSLVEFDGSRWITINKGDANSYSIQSIYGTGKNVFAGGKKDASWDIFTVNNGAMIKIISNTGPLTGAISAGSDFYVSAGEKGIYKVSSPSSPMTGSGGNVTGIINVNGTITAVTWDGRILINTGNSFTTISSEALYYTGAMAVYKGFKDGQWKDSLLLLGVQTNSSYDKGYRELTLVNGAMPTDGRNPVKPGGDLSSVRPENVSKYEASLARYSVHHILQIPNEVDNFQPNPQYWEPLIFASTTGNGVYVLRNGLWNAQD